MKPANQQISTPSLPSGRINYVLIPAQFHSALSLLIEIDSLHPNPLSISNQPKRNWNGRESNGKCYNISEMSGGLINVGWN